MDSMVCLLTLIHWIVIYPMDTSSSLVNLEKPRTCKVKVLGSVLLTAALFFLPVLEK